MDRQRHCILVAASNPCALPTPVFRSSVQNLEKNESYPEAQSESWVSDAEMVAKSFPQCFVSLSVISPKQLPTLRAIYNAGKRNTQAIDSTVDNGKNPQFLVLLSDSFMEARASLSHPGITNLAPNPSSLKLESTTVPPISGPTPSIIPSVKGPLMNRQPIPVGNIPPATVKVESNTVAPTVSALSHLLANGAPQGAAGLQPSSPSPASQEMGTINDSVQEFKPLVNGMPQPLRPTGHPAVNANTLNYLSQVCQAMSSASSIGLQTIGGPPMDMHMSSMISSGMASSVLPAAQTVFSSGQAGITSIAGSGPLVGTWQVAQNTALAPFSSVSSTMSGNSNIGISPSLGNLQGAVAMGQSGPGMGQGNLTTGTQIGQNGQNMMNGLVLSDMSSGAGTMIPTPGMTQQLQAGLPTLGINNGSTANLALPQHTLGTLQSQSKYLKVWEGSLYGQKQGQPVFLCRIESYRNATASETVAADWPTTMQIARLISQDHMNNKQYVGNADMLVFRALNSHGFLDQL